MSKKHKIWLVRAAFLIVTGGLIFTIAMTKHNWDFSKLNTVEYEFNTYTIAEEFNESRNNVYRYIRLTELIPELLKMVDEKAIAFRPAVEISYLTKEEQTNLLDAMDCFEATPSLAQAIQLKKISQQGQLDIEKIDETAVIIKKIDGISTVNYGEEYIESVVKIFDVIEKVCIGGVVALILVTAFLISNTIKLAIFSRKTEIEIMRLVGASNVSIKVPFLIEGSFIGFFGAIIPIILMAYGYNSFYNFLGGKLFSSSLGELVKPYPFILWGSGLLLVIGLLVGMFGSYNAVKKYLKI